MPDELTPQFDGGGKQLAFGVVTNLSL